MKRNYLLLILLLVSCLIHAQNSEEGAFAMQTGDYHSPEVQALKRYGQIPISYFTGATQINIPLYEAEIRGFKFGISASYNSSGVKVDDIASVIGLGWVLNAGGVISRTINGIPDETPQRGFLTKPFTTNQLTKDYYKRYMYNTMDPHAIDCAADEFTYNFMGYSGKFAFGTDQKIHLLPFKNLKIEFVNGAYFKIITEEGHAFIFNEAEKTVFNSHGGTIATTAWHLTKIILNNNGGEINFSYITGATYEDRFPSFASSKVENNGFSGDPTVFYNLVSNIEKTAVSFSYIATSTKYLSEIKFSPDASLGKIAFEYDDATRRLDYLSGKILRSIKVYNSSSTSVTPIRHWEFAQKFSLCDAGYSSSYHYNSDQYRMFLSSISEVTHQFDKEVYSMEYDSTPLPCRKSFGKDLWGYYNGKSSNPNGIYINALDAPEITRLKFPSGINNDRKGNETYMKAGSLTKLIYPTAGYTLFEYEGHQISVTERAGGLRIKSIKNYTDNRLAESRFFKYGLNENGLARISTFNYNQNYKKLPGGYYYARSQGTDNASYTVHTLSDYPFYPSNIGYEYVTEYNGTEATPSGKTEYRYDFKMDDLADSYGVYPNPQLFISNSWQNGEPKETKFYAKTAGGYNLVRKETNIYNRYHLSQSESYCVNLLYNYSGDMGGRDDILTNMHAEELYSYTLVPIISEANKKVESSVTDYFYNSATKDSIVTNTRYEYGGLYNSKYPHDFATRTKIIDSSNDSISIENRYIADVIANPPTGHTVYKTLFEQNRISTPLEVITRRKGKVIQAQVNLFRQDVGSNIVPKEQKILETTIPLSNYSKLSITSAEIMDSRLTTNMLYTKFNSKGNLMEFTKRDKVNTVVLWGYSNQYPIARIEGASYDEVEKVLTKAVIDGLEGNSNPTLIGQSTKLLTSSFAKKTVLVNLYAYKPLVGMISKTAPNSQINSYTYDEMGRLYQEKDHESKVVQSFLYRWRINSAPSVSFNTQASYTFGSTLSVSATIDGGSGEFSNVWTLKNSSGTIIYTSTASTLPTVSIPLQQSGTLTLTCTTTDKVTGKTNSYSKTFSVLQENLDFIDVVHSTGKVTASIICTEACTIEFDLVVDIKPGSTAKYWLAGDNYTFTASGRETQSINFQPGIHKLEVTLNTRDYGNYATLYMNRKGRITYIQAYN